MNERSLHLRLMLRNDGHKRFTGV